MLITTRKQLRVKKAIAIFMLITLVNQGLTPSIAYALTAGPTAAEATNFEPIDTTDMVNPLNGAFTYNMPLLEVPGPEGGYPLALSYHAGIQPNEEASWVGLGWSLNPGAIARNVNGYPDDWSGSHGAGGSTNSFWSGGTTNTFSIGVSVGGEFMPVSVNAGLSFSQDTYRGFGVGWDIGVGYSIGLGGSNSIGLGATIGVSPYGDGYASLNVSYRSSFAQNSLHTSAGIGVQTNFKSVSVEGSASVSISDKNGNYAGASISSSSMRPSFSVGGGSISSVTDANKGSNSSWVVSSNQLTLPVPVVSISLGWSTIRYASASTASFSANGVLYNRSSRANQPGLQGDFANTDDDNYSILDPKNSNTIDDPLTVPGGTFPNFDDYSVSAQGLSGNMRPYIFSSFLFNQDRVNNNDHSNDVYDEDFPSNTTPNPIGNKWQFRFVNDLANSYRQGHPWGSDQQYGLDGNPQYGNNSGAAPDGTYGYDPLSNRLEGTNHIEYFTNGQISSTNYAASRGFITVPDGAGFVRANCDLSQIGGFMITNSSGVTYHYALPAYSSNEVQHTEIINSQPHGFSSSDLNKNTAYAYTWYLTAITGPDYVSRGATPGVIDPSDWGYWVKFDYGKWADSYGWRTPAEGMAPDLDNNFQNVTTGFKEIYYLDAIETRTHTAIFEKQLRADGKSSFGYNPGGVGNGITQPYASSLNQLLSGNLICNNAHSQCNTAYIYPVPTLCLKDILLFQNDQLTVSINSLRQNSNQYGFTGLFTFSAPNNPDGTINTVSRRVFHAENVIDNYDVDNTTIASNCLRRIAFNFDYSLCPGVPNSFDPNGQIYSTTPNTNVFPDLGKLTLLSVDMQGRAGAAITPPIQFQYDLDPTNLANQGNISITQASANTAGVNQYGTIQLQSSGNFNVGDILNFQVNASTYYCTLLSTTDGVNYNVLFLNNSPGTTTGVIPAVKTKNPPYNHDAFDNWQCYKSDYIANSGNVNLARFTTPVSNLSADVWSLRRVVSSVGANVNINYEGNTFSRSVLTKNPSVVVSSSQINPDGTMDMIASVPANFNLSQFFTNVNTVTGPLVFYRKGILGSVVIQGYNIIDLNSYPNTTIVSVTGSDIKLRLDPNLLSFLQTGPISGQSVSSINTINLTTGNLVPNTNGNVSAGAGIRVKNITVDDLNGNVMQTAYNYGALGVPPGQPSTSGITSYLPATLDQDNLSNALSSNSYQLSANDQAAIIKNYHSILYKDASYLLSISRVVPAPGVLYETVAINDFSILPNGTSVPIDGTTVYQYEVFKPEMIGLVQYYYEAPNSKPGNSNGDGTAWHSSNSGSGYRIVRNSARDVSIKDYTSRVGNLKRVITYDNYGNKLSEKINHYLYDDLENTSVQNQINNYEPRLATFTGVSNYNGVAYNDMGVILERYGTARAVIDPAHVSPGTPSNNQYNEMLVMSNKETFPSFQTGTTEIDYKNGTKVNQTNLAYDFYTGAVTKTLITDSYGNRFISVATPAYMAGNGTAYPALGLKTHDDDPGATQHAQMLSQQASNYTFSVDANNNPIGVVKATAQTWSNNIPVLDQGGNSTTVGQSNIWRMNSSYSWMPTGTATNNLQPYSAFADFYGTTNGGSSNSAWKKTSQITQYNVYSAALEASDINNNFAATRMGYNNSKVLFTGGTARYNEIAYAGAEDALLSNGNFSNNISPGGGSVVVDSTKSHTGTNSLMVPANANGFTYSVPVTNLNTSRNYSVSVWVKPPPSGSVSQANLYYSVNGNTVTPAQTYAKSAAGCYLLEMTVPASALTSAGGNLVVGCSNNGSANVLYFDDFRFQPTSASATAYVYDNKTGELTYILGNNNLYTRFQYDAIGRLVRTYREVLGKSTIPLVKSVAYNYGIVGRANWQNNGVTRCQQANGANDGYLDVQQQDMNPNSPTYNSTKWVATANLSVGCPVPIFACLQQTSSSTGSWNGTSYNYGNYLISLYKDAAGTMPFTLTSPLAVNYVIQQYITDANGNPSYNNLNETVIGVVGQNTITIGNINTHECSISGTNPFTLGKGNGNGSNCMNNTVSLSAGPGYSIMFNCGTQNLQAQ